MLSDKATVQFFFFFASSPLSRSTNLLVHYPKLPCSIEPSARIEDLHGISVTKEFDFVVLLLANLENPDLSSSWVVTNSSFDQCGEV
eukprot:1946448-Rhodomonas_salina.1